MLDSILLYALAARSISAGTPKTQAVLVENSLKVLLQAAQHLRTGNGGLNYAFARRKSDHLWINWAWAVWTCTLGPAVVS